MISIIIPTYTNVEGLKKCIDSIKKYTDLSDKEVVIVANGCPNETIKFFETLKGNFKLLYFNEALGYPRAVNEGLRFATGDQIILLNDDCILLDQGQDDWVKMLTEPLKDKKNGITGLIKAWCDKADAEFIIFFCCAFRSELLKKIGYLDESFGVGAGEDTDFCIRATRAGYNLVQVPDQSTKVDGGLVVGGFPIYHEGEATVKKIDGWNEIFKGNSDKLMARYKLPDGWFYGDDIKEYRRLVSEVPRFGTLVELGVWRGRSLCSVADIIKKRGIKVIAVDTFEGTPNEGEMHAFAKTTDLKKDFEANLKRFGIEATVYKMTTNKAVAKVKSADLVFVDADHSFEAVKQDIANWSPKTKVIAGHDYGTWEGVTKSVEEFKKPHIFGSVWSIKL
jgi:glycosyltransferase involved in cell wall biosynthesis